MKIRAIDSKVGAPQKSQKELLGEIIRSPQWSSIAKAVCMWQYKLGGEFNERLWAALTIADEVNLEKFRMGFPIETAALIEWRTGDIARRLREAGLDI